jgi:hypothetical protein
MNTGLRILAVAVPLAAAALTITRRPTLVPNFRISPYGLA